MRALAVALLLSVPLSAGEAPALEKAVGLFRSPDASNRAAGSQLAQRELRRLLAPLLEAMRDDDPEVRRRARRSILSLVPGAAEQEEAETPRTPEAIRQKVLQLRARQTKLLRAAAAQARRGREERERRAKRLLHAFGVRGTKWVPRKKGWFVQAVTKGSPAERLGLRRGDVIVRVNGLAVTRSRDFATALGDNPDWNRITVTRLRNGQLLRLPQK